MDLLRLAANRLIDHGQARQKSKTFPHNLAASCRPQE
jgi:hypothetical protein